MIMSISIIERPFFIVGAERSGTTLLRLMLDHHTQLSWCNEFEYAIDLISDRGHWPQLKKYHRWLETHRIFQDSQFEIDLTLDYLQLINSFLIQKQTRDNKRLVGATVHRHFDRLLKIWPNAKFIHIVRDGRDVARSCIGMGWAGNVWTGVERWIKAESLWKNISESISAEQKIEVTYESLISQCEDTLKSICSFIEIPFELGMLAYEHTTSYDLPDPKLIQQWKHKLSEKEIQIIESRISDMLLERNYELSGLPLMKITPIMQQILSWQDKAKCTYFRINRLGLVLFIADNLSRRFNIDSWQRNIKLKVNDINRSYLK